jgi:ribose transport system ATP-binding protein
MSEVLLALEHISKSFPGVLALDDARLEVEAGEVHALMGENGAGKSTLMKILTGALPKDTGTIRIAGRAVSIQSPSDALALGISMIHQELNLIPHLDVGQNIFLGREPSHGGGRIDWRTLYRRTGDQLALMKVDLDPHASVDDLTIAQQQMVEIAKALSRQARIIVMDEPTSALTDRETEHLFELIRSLRDQGVTLIYISHRMEEIFSIADRVTVLRDGKYIATYPVRDVTETDLVHLMVGREIGELYPQQAALRQNVVLAVKDLASANCLHHVNFELYRGEIVGLAGLVGSGRSTLARTVFGAERATQGEIWIDGDRVTLSSPQVAIRQGIGLVPEDRKEQALFLNMAVSDNIVMSGLATLARAGFVDFPGVRRMAQQYIDALDIRTPSLGQRVRNLSGGNQQKVVISRWLMLNPRILILDEPTRGIDVGAKAEIHALMNDLARKGIGILMISSELPEILGVSDRILVMREGEIVAELPRAQATQDAIMLAAIGTLTESAGVQAARAEGQNGEV